MLEWKSTSTALFPDPYLPINSIVSYTFKWIYKSIRSIENTGKRGCTEIELIIPSEIYFKPFVSKDKKSDPIEETTDCKTAS